MTALEPQQRISYSVVEVAAMVDKSPRCIRHWCEQGLLDAFRIGGKSHWMIPVRVVNELRDGTYRFST